MNAATLPTHDPAAGRRTLALVVGLLMLPFVLGAGLYLSGWQPSRAGNHGELLQPPLPLALPQDLASETAGKWLLILAGSGPCTADCIARIDEMRRIQVSLNKDMGRLRRLILAADAGDPALAAARAAQPDLLLVSPGRPWPDPATTAAGYRLYVADPGGNLILRYAPDAEAKGIRADLERLLKFAWTA